MCNINYSPLVLNILCTENCPFNCIHCYIHDKELKNCTSEILLDEIFNLIDKYPSIMFCNVSGGEPLLYKEFEKLWRFLHSKKLFLTLSTNLALYNADTQALLERYPPWKINVSLYGFSEDTYHSITGVANIRDIVYKNLYKIISLLPKTSIIYVKIPVIRGIWEEIDQIVHFCEELGIEYGFVTVLYPPRNSEYSLSQLLINRDDYFDFIMNGVKQNIILPLDDERLGNFTKLRPCCAWQQIEINHNAEISNCLDFKFSGINHKEILPKNFFSFNEKCVTCKAHAICGICNAKIVAYEKSNFDYQNYYCWAYKKIITKIMEIKKHEA